MPDGLSHPREYEQPRRPKRNHSGPFIAEELIDRHNRKERRQRGDGQAVAPEFPELDVKSCLKQQTRQEYLQEKPLGQMGRREKVLYTERQPT